MVKKYSDFEKHVTGRQSQVGDFVKHDCPATKQKRWIKGKEETVSMVQKKEFNSIKGNENLIAVNSAASDVCPYCGVALDDNSMIPCTEADVEALSK